MICGFRSRRCEFLVVMLFVFVLSACGAGPSGDAAPGDEDAGPIPPAQPPSIRGSLTRLQPAAAANQEVLGTALIEENPAEQSGSDKALVTITNRTRIFSEQGDALRPAVFADLAQGQMIKAWFDGPVRESYPVQADAGVLIIAEQ